MDEAYIDFAESGSSAVALVNQYDNLLVVQTMSKSRSLAGLRIGYAMGSAELIEGLERIKNSFNSYPSAMCRLPQVLLRLKISSISKRSSAGDQ